MRQIIPAHVITAVKPYVPTPRDALIALAFLACLLASQALGQKIDDVVGKDATSKVCTTINSIEGSLVLKIICGGIVLWGALLFLPTRKNGIPQILTGVVGFLILNKFTAFTKAFGFNCA